MLPPPDSTPNSDIIMHQPRPPTILAVSLTMRSVGGDDEGEEEPGKTKNIRTKMGEEQTIARHTELNCSDYFKEDKQKD